LRDLKRPIFLYLFFVCAALLYATKETSIIVYAVLGLSVLTTELGVHALHRFKAHSPFTDLKKRTVVFVTNFRFHILIAVAMAIAIWVLLYSSFFTNPKGLGDSFRTYAIWTKTGVNSGHEKRFWYFLEDILFPYETPLLLMALAGGAMALVSRKKSGLFLLSWATGIFLAHSLIPYKTPWLALNMLPPLALLGGFGLQELVDRFRARRHPHIVVPSFVVLLLACALLLIRQFPLSVWMAYVEYDNEAYPHIYVHTSRDIYRLMDDIENIARDSGQGQNIKINIVCPHEWPMPFYLRNYPNALFWRTYEAVPELDSPLIIAETSQHAELAKQLREPYVTRPYLLRKGIPLELWVSKDLIHE
jgi:uncharacterized protein (TIGR03663 family)